MPFAVNGNARIIVAETLDRLAALVFDDGRGLRPVDKDAAYEALTLIRRDGGAAYLEAVEKQHPTKAV